MSRNNFYNTVLKPESIDSTRKNSNILQTIYHGFVVDVNDDNISNRIRVLVPQLDTHIKTDSDVENLPWCNPILPSHLIVQPQIGEHVLVIPAYPAYPQTNRFWIGPHFGEYSYSGEQFIDVVSRFTNEKK